MGSLSVNGNILSMILNTGVMVKFVLLLLLIFSVVSWAIIFLNSAAIIESKRE